MYMKLGNGNFAFCDSYDEVIFESKAIGILTRCGQIFCHGSFENVSIESHRLSKEGKGDFSICISTDWDINDLNKKVGELMPIVL